LLNTYHAILEIEGHYRGKDGQRLIATLEDIQRSSIEGKDIIAIHYHEEPTKVIHYGYNYLCRDHCQHEPASYGIYRYFNVTIIVDGELSNPFVKLQPNNYSRLEICGHDMPYTGERREMLKVEIAV